jgi:hypothetical protein
LDNEDIYEEDKIDQLEDLVKRRFPSLPQKDVERRIMDILWKHKDPSRKDSHIVKVEQRVSNIDFEEIDKKIELERQSAVLNTIGEVDKEYNEVLQKIKDLNFEIYGNRQQKKGTAKSPLDTIVAIFSGAVSKPRIEQALKVSGYNIVEACTLILNQLKKDRRGSDSSPTVSRKPLFSRQDNIPKAVLCSYLLKTGQCLRSDCPFSHDLGQRVCHFWIKGSCLAGDNCKFQHSIDGIDSVPLGDPSESSTRGPITTNSSIKTTAGSTTTAAKPKYSFSSIPSFTPSAPVLIQRPLTMPKLLPWDEKNHTLFKAYIDARNSATRNEALRKKFAQKSTEAWKANNGESSKKFSDKANNFEDKVLDCLKRADDELYAYSETTKDEIWFEMHGLEYNVAIDQLESNLDVARSRENDGKLVYLVVPATTDFQNFKKITKPLEIWLDQEGYRWQIFNLNSIYGSLIVVDQK